LGARMVATVRCAPPDNRPTIEERETCAPWLLREVSLVAGSVRAVVCLGSYGWDAALRTFRALGYGVPRPKPRFGHGAEAVITSPAGHMVTVLGSYHPSQQNTFTGKLTEPMLDSVFSRAKRCVEAALGSAHDGSHGRMTP
jgi:uracil-DNA glycosylase